MIYKEFLAEATRIISTDSAWGAHRITVAFARAQPVVLVCSYAWRRT